ncbi:methylaspartate mutase [Streptomyces zaomyceticus]|uniref:methylaspartate mutase n=1 Tax=Streptomyces zaomyceticus TaxID=68286 RepID=UPI00199BFC35|nr:methylaspartate mutase [Streptomyces zaomyceticus]GHG33167.1 methylaspartate mutase [Streptomyces zaomyceticus]
MTTAPPSAGSPGAPAAGSASFGAFVARAYARGELVVQPRMGFGDPGLMREGLERTRAAEAVTVGTLTLDSYTRVNDLPAARRAVAEGVPLNGYPLCTHSPAVSRDLLDGVHGPRFPVQVRHGSPKPEHIVAALLSVGLDATEGGPVSYCLPYGRTRLDEAVASWRTACAMLAAAGGTTPDGRTAGGGTAAGRAADRWRADPRPADDEPASPGDPVRLPHLESFGGCMLGQLCPPSMLVAISVLEGVFFARHGLRSISLSYAQQTSPAQDLEAMAALRALSDELLPDIDRHLVVYAYMGVYPTTRSGALSLLEAAARLAVESGAARLIVKTAAEAHRIPTIADNVEALETAARAARSAVRRPPVASDLDTEVYAEARALVHTVLGLHEDIGEALLLAFRQGLLDIPFCLHPDNAGLARSFIDSDGRLRWSDTGRLPLPVTAVAAARKLTSADLLTALTRVQRTYDPGGIR